MDYQKNNIRSETIQEMMIDTPSWIVRWGNIIITAVLLMIVSLLCFIKYPEILYADANIESSSPPNKIIAETSGNLTELFVKEDDRIFKGNPLAIIHNTAVFPDVMRLEKLITSFHISEAKFDMKINEYSSLQLGEMENEFGSFLEAYRDYHDNKNTYIHKNDQNISINSLRNIDLQLIKLQEQRLNSTKILELQSQDLKRNRLLHEKGVISDQEYQSQESEYIRDQSTFKNIDLLTAQMETEKNSIEKKYSNLNYSKEFKDDEVAWSVILTIRKLKEAIAIWKNKYVLSSDIDGIVSISNFRTNGRYVQKGEIVFNIIPSESQEIKAILKLESYNFGKVKKNQPVRITLANYPKAEFGMIEGKINQIGKIPNADGTYSVEAILTTPLKSTLGYDIPYIPDMRGYAEITTNRASVLKHFFRGLNKSRR